MDDKLSMRGVWSRHVTHFKFRILYADWPCVLAFVLT